MRKNKLVYIEWEDSQASPPTWRDLEGFKPNLPVMKSVGWIVFEDKVNLSLCQSIAHETADTNLQGSGIITIPKRAITKKQVISSL